VDPSTGGAGSKGLAPNSPYQPAYKSSLEGSKSIVTLPERISVGGGSTILRIVVPVTKTVQPIAGIGTSPHITPAASAYCMRSWYISLSLNFHPKNLAIAADAGAGVNTRPLA